MKVRTSALRSLAVIFICVAIGSSAVACSPSVSEGSGGNTAGVTDPNDVPEDDTDYSIDAGNETPEYEYEDEPAAPESVVSTLCNLNREYISSFRSDDGGSPVVDDNLRTNLVGFSDLLSTWETLRAQYPDSSRDIDTARAIYDAWDRALLSNDNGDGSQADASMIEAEILLNRLPENTLASCQ